MELYCSLRKLAKKIKAKWNQKKWQKKNLQIKISNFREMKRLALFFIKCFKFNLVQ